MKKYYNTNYSILATLLLPLRFRKPLMLAMIKSMVRPLEVINESFVRYVDDIVPTAKSQVCYLQAMLNDEFDFLLRRVKIRTTAIDLDSLITHSLASDVRIPVPTNGRVLLNAKYQIGVNEKDFEIIFPKGFNLTTAQNTQLKQIVNRHKLATKKYQLINE